MVASLQRPFDRQSVGQCKHTYTLVENVIWPTDAAQVWWAGNTSESILHLWLFLSPALTLALKNLRENQEHELINQPKAIFNRYINERIFISISKCVSLLPRFDWVGFNTFLWRRGWHERHGAARLLSTVDPSRNQRCTSCGLLLIGRVVQSMHTYLYGSVRLEAFLSCTACTSLMRTVNAERT